jgi:hypothetical protein
MKKTYTGSCHCGAIHFEADIDLSEGTGRCNCSMCRKTRNWSAQIKPDAFRLLKGEGDLSSYQFGSNSCDHLFCKHCGIRSFGRGYVEEIGGAYVSVAVMSLDGLSDEELAALPVKYMDGRGNNWWNPPAVTGYM